MNLWDALTHGLSLAQQAMPLFERAAALIKKLRDKEPRFSYENLSVAIVVDLQDSTGRKAEVTCSQRVRFLVAEAGVITSHVWGEGQRVKGLSLVGVRSLERRAEGSRDLLLLGLKRRPGVLTTATLKAKRTIAGGFMKNDEYFEVSVERPTKLLSLRILFPKRRPPRDAHVIGGKASKEQRRSVRVGHEGRPELRWSQRLPEIDRVYRLNWSW